MDEATSIYVERLGQGRSDVYPSRIDRSLYYDGHHNPLTYERDYREEFFCNFKYDWYPFDVQTCFMTFKTAPSLIDSVVLVPDQMNTFYTGHKTLLLFKVDFDNFLPQNASNKLQLQIQ